MKNVQRVFLNRIRKDYWRGLITMSEVFGYICDHNDKHDIDPKYDMKFESIVFRNKKHHLSKPTWVYGKPSNLAQKHQLYTAVKSNPNIAYFSA